MYIHEKVHFSSKSTQAMIDILFAVQ